MKKNLLLVSILALFGCELALDVEVPYEEKMTLNSFFTADSLWHVDLSLNRDILDKTNFKTVRDATVFVYHDGQPIDTLLHKNNGQYYSDTGKPFNGASYTIVANSPTVGTVSGTSVLPKSIQVTAVKLVSHEGTSGNASTVDVKVKFDDPGDANDFYQIKVERAWIYTVNGVSKVNWNDIYVKTDDPSLGNGDYQSSLIFRDILFNGKTAEINFEIDTYALGDLRIRVRHVSADYYRYVRTVQLQHETSGDPFAQPTNVYNNIDNGTGIFAGYSESVYVYEMPDPVIDKITPSQGRVGDHVIITGQNFYPGGRLPLVLFKGEQFSPYAQIITVANDRIEVIVPNFAITGPISVGTSGGATTSSINFEVLK